MLPFTIIFLLVFYGRHAVKRPLPLMSQAEKLDSFDDFDADKITLVKKENGQAVLRLSADKIVRRRRSSKLFFYHNLKELYLSGVRIDVLSSADASADPDKKIHLPLAFIGSCLASMGGKPLMSLTDYVAGKADIHSKVLSRLIFEGMSLNLYLSRDKQISFNALRASINADFSNIVFEGSVRIIDSDNGEIRASSAVWSNKYGGIYFPEGYVKKNNNYRKTFYYLNEPGNFIKAAKLPQIDYADILENREKALYALMFVKLPPKVKLFLGIPSK